jgi:hypothetical protein
MFTLVALFALMGSPTLATWCAMGAVACAIGWLLFGPGGRWL